MKGLTVFIAITLFLVGFICAFSVTSSAVDNSTGQDDDSEEKVCCSITGVYPDAVPSYKWVERKECDDVSDDGEPIVGAHKEIADNSLCVAKNIHAVISAKKANLTEEQKEKIRKWQNKINVTAKYWDSCPEACTCTGSTVKCILENGREMTVYAGNSGNVIVQVKGENMTTNVTLYKSEGKVYAVLKNNETKVIKMLPDQVKERIRERFQRRLEKENISLDEDGTYQYRAEKKARLFLVFPVKVLVRAEIDPETGEIIKVKGKWWQFLAKDEAGEQLVGASCGTVTPGMNDACCQEKGFDVWNSETVRCEFSE